MLVRHVTLSTIWLQPSTPPTKHLGCDLQCASCRLVSWSRNRVAVSAGRNETLWLTRGVLSVASWCDVMWDHDNVVLCFIISQEAASVKLRVKIWFYSRVVLRGRQEAEDRKANINQTIRAVWTSPLIDWWRLSEDWVLIGGWAAGVQDDWQQQAGGASGPVHTHTHTHR